MAFQVSSFVVLVFSMRPSRSFSRLSETLLIPTDMNAILPPDARVFACGVLSLLRSQPLKLVNKTIYFG